MSPCLPYIVWLPTLNWCSSYITLPRARQLTNHKRYIHPPPWLHESWEAIQTQRITGLNISVIFHIMISRSIYHVHFPFVKTLLIVSLLRDVAGWPEEGQAWVKERICATHRSFERQQCAPVSHLACSSQNYKSIIVFPFHGFLPRASWSLATFLISPLPQWFFHRPPVCLQTTVCADSQPNKEFNTHCSFCSQSSSMPPHYLTSFHSPCLG